MTALPAHPANLATGRPERTTRLIRTAVAVLSVQGITWLASLVEVLVVPRSLGSADYGLVSTSFQIAQVLLLVGMFGTSSFIVREVARAPHDGRAIVLSAMLLRVVLWGLIAGSALLVMPFFTDSTTARLVFAIVIFAATMQLVTEGSYAGLQGNQTLGSAALAGAVVGIGSQLVLAAVLLGGAGVVSAVLVGAFGGAASALVTMLLLVRNVAGPLRASWNRARITASGSAAFLAWDLGRKVYAVGGLIMVAALADSNAAGHFAFAYRLFGIPSFVATALVAALFPALSAAVKSDSQWYSQTITQGARLVALATIPMAIGLAVLAPEITHVLSGSDFDDAAIPLVLLAIGIPAVSIHTVIGVGLFASDRHRLMGVVAWIAAGTTIALNLAAVPLSTKYLDNGAIGAAAVTLATEAVVGVFLWRAMWSDLHGRSLLISIFKALVAGAVMGMMVFASKGVGGIFLAIPVGTMSFLAVALAIRSFTLSEIRDLLQSARVGRGT